MDWILLIFVIPLILVPIVLLCGFAGCAQLAGISGSDETPSPPPPPTLLKVTQEGTTGVQLSWSPDSSVAFIVDACGADSGVGAFVPVASGLSDASFTDTVKTGLTEGTTYTYRLRATKGGSSPSMASGRFRVTTQPNAPTDLQTKFSGVSLVEITWVNRTANKSAEFRVERRTPPGAGAFKPLTPTVKNASYFQDVEAPAVELVSGSQHEYQVVTIIPNGFDNDMPKRVESDPSAPPLFVAIV